MRLDCLSLILLILLSLESWWKVSSVREHAPFQLASIDKYLPLRIAITVEFDHECLPLQESLFSLRELLIAQGVTFEVVAFINTNPGAVLHDQAYMNYLLDMKAKLDFSCLHFLFEDLSSCILQSSLREKVKGLFVFSGYDESNYMGFRFYDHSTLSSIIGISIDTSPTVHVETSPRYEIVVDAPLHSHESDGACDLWWPLNDTDLLLYNYIPENLPLLRIETNYILKCLFPIEILQGTESLPTLTLTDYVESIDSQQYTKTHQRAISFENHRFNMKERQFVPVIFTTTVLLEFVGTTQPVRKKQLSLIFDERGHRLATFNISLNILYLNEILQSQQSKATNYSNYQYFLQTWLSHIESRDDLGFLFSALFPTTANHSTILVEVGVNKGNFAKILLNTWPSLSLYVGIDAWKTWTEDEYLDIANYDEHEDNYATTIENILDTSTDTAKLVIRQESLRAASFFKEDSVDVVYLDAMHHYTAVLEDMKTWWPKIRPGGVLAGHDYLLGAKSATIFTVKPAVEKFARERSLMILQTNDLTYPSYPSWFIVKPLN